MVNYEFEKTNLNSDSYADYKHLSDITTLYLDDIYGIVREHDWQDPTGILYETILQIYIHEDIHAAIENSDIDSLGDAQHEVIYPIIFKWMNNKDDSSLGY